MNPKIELGELVQFEFEKSGKRFRATLDEGISIAIDLEFDGEQPSHFGAPPATRVPVEANGFVGSVIRGGSCNVDVVTINPHCNGTHTETVGHIFEEPVPISSIAYQPLLIAKVISMEPKRASKTKDNYRPEFNQNDSVIDFDLLTRQLDRLSDSNELDALIIRTTPNCPSKKTIKYGGEINPAFFTIEAIQFINKLGVRHLLVDLPSIDRMHDDGKLTNHHIYWGVPEGATKCETARRDKTITELVYVPDSVDDRCYLLNLQVPAFSLDAAPSRPVLYPLEITGP